MTFAALCRRATSLGLAVRGAFHPEPREFDQLLPAAQDQARFHMRACLRSVRD
jgi:hypothetical protein